MKCPNCGAEGEKGKYCEYCGIRLPEDPVIINITNNYYGDAPDETPQKKPEQPTQPQMDVYKQGNTWTVESKESPKEKSSKKVYLWYFLVLCFLPFFLTYWILTSDKLKGNKKTRITLVVILWVVLLIIYAVSPKEETPTDPNANNSGIESVQEDSEL